MKSPLSLILASATVLAATLGLSHAGSIGGPGPFRNGSPLPTGTDGTYNASFQGANLSGVFRFSISNGSQAGDVVLPNMSLMNNPSGNNPGILSPNVPGQEAGDLFMPIYSSRNNVWVAFYQGIAYRGLTDAMISEGSVSGVLDAMQPPSAQQGQQDDSITVNYAETLAPTTATILGNGSRTITSVTDPPTVTITDVTDNSSNITITQNIETLTNTFFPRPGITTALQGGFFDGRINLNSPYALMKGNGVFVVVTDNDTTNNTITNGNITNLPTPEQLQTRFTARSIPFTWRGSRVFTGQTNLAASTQ